MDARWSFEEGMDGRKCGVCGFEGEDIESRAVNAGQVVAQTKMTVVNIDLKMTRPAANAGYYFEDNFICEDGSSEHMSSRVHV